MTAARGAPAPGRVRRGRRSARKAHQHGTTLEIAVATHTAHALGVPLEHALDTAGRQRRLIDIPDTGVADVRRELQYDITLGGDVVLKRGILDVFSTEPQWQRRVVQSVKSQSCTGSADQKLLVALEELLDTPFVESAWATHQVHLLVAGPGDRPCLSRATEAMLVERITRDVWPACLQGRITFFLTAAQAAAWRTARTQWPAAYRAASPAAVAARTAP